MGEPFILAEYVQKNEIDTVVFDGDIFLFTGEEYL